MTASSDSALLDADAQRRLGWRCRRGLLENDLFISRFLEHYQATLTVAQARGLLMLMELPDNDLLDLLLSRTELSSELSQHQEVHQVLKLMRT